MKLEDAIQQIEIHLKAHDADQCYIEPMLEIALITILSHYYISKSLDLQKARGGYLKEQSIFNRPQNPDPEYWLTEERLTKLLAAKKSNIR